MNLYINIPYKTGEHKNETKNTNFICLYIKISISPLFSFFFFSISPLVALCPALGGPTASRGVVRVHTSTQNTSMQKVKTNPYRYNFKMLASKMRVNSGTGDGAEGQKLKTKTKKESINGAYKLASGVFNTSFLLLLFDLNLFELKYTKSALAYIN